MRPECSRAFLFWVRNILSFQKTKAAWRAAKEGQLSWTNRTLPPPPNNFKPGKPAGSLQQHQQWSPSIAPQLWVPWKQNSELHGIERACSLQTERTSSLGF